MPRDLAIDLGTATTLVYGRGQGILLDQPTVITVDSRTGAIVALGEEAQAMVGRAPEHMVPVRPLRGGVVCDYDTTARMLRRIYQEVGVGRFSRPRVVLCVPAMTTAVERRAVQEAAMEAGARRAYLIEGPVAAAIGAGLPVQEPVGSLVVDAGAGTTEVACVSLGGIVTARAVRVAGFDLDAAIAHYIRREYALVIGERTCEEIKLTLGTAAPQPGEGKAEVRGRELATGLPKTVTLTAEEVREAMEEPLNQIVGTVTQTLSEIPGDLVGDVLDKGIFLTGGTSLLAGLPARIAREAHVAVHRTEEPRASVVLGAGQVVESLDEMAPLLLDSSGER